MAKDPAFLFYPNDWLGGTIGMTFEEKGAYMELLMAQFNRGHMTSHMCGQIVGQTLWEILRDKFQQDAEGRYFNARLEYEVQRRRSYTESRKNNKKGINQHTSKTGHMTSHMTGHMENENENENINRNKDKGVVGGKEKEVHQAEVHPTFEEIWTMYDHKVNKESAKKAYKRLTQHDREAAYTKIPLYVKSLSDRKFQAHLATWLNGRRWEDEYETKKTKRISRAFKDEQELADFLAVRPDGC